MHEHLPERRLQGGLRLPPGKAASTAAPIRRGLAPRKVIVSLSQGRGLAASPVVNIGDLVVRGQTIATADAPAATGAHASIAGRVAAIAEHQVPGYDHLESTVCITIEAIDSAEVLARPAARPWPEDRAAQIACIRAAGIVGLGGAAFPTAVKLSTESCQTLIINGAECEPYISCDDMLMREAADEIVMGAAIMGSIVGAGKIIFAIERDKPDAIETMHAALTDSGRQDMRIAELPSIYPAGGERQLIHILTGIETPTACFPSDVGIVCQNVGTAFAIARLASHGEPLTSRIVTVTGSAIREPGNVEVPIGTPIDELIAYCGGDSLESARLIHGGSMMGYELTGTSVPVTKSTNCLIVAAEGELKQPTTEWPCIRCGECALACPVRLMPQDLLLSARSKDADALETQALPDCIECGCCDVVCPSHIPLTSEFKTAKNLLAHTQSLRSLSEKSAERFLRREARTRASALDISRRQQSLKEQIDDPQARQDVIAAAVARARRRKIPDPDTEA